MSRRQTHAGRPIGRMDAAASQSQPVPQTRVGFTRESGAAAEDWRRKAPCLPWRLKARGIAPKIFFPASKDDAADAARAKEICVLECPVRERCLEFAFESGCSDGIFGGLDSDERRAVKRKAARGATGTNRRYSEEQRAEVLAAAGEALAGGASLESAAYTVGKAFGVDKKSVIRWLEAGNGSGAACGAQEASGGPVGRESATGAGEPPLRPGMVAVESCPSVAVAPMGENQSAKESANA